MRNALRSILKHFDDVNAALMWLWWMSDNSTNAVALQRLKIKILVTLDVTGFASVPWDTKCAVPSHHPTSNFMLSLTWATGHPISVKTVLSWVYCRSRLQFEPDLECGRA